MNIRTFISTRDSNPALAKSFKDAILNPSAPQGGLYTFDTLPKLSTQDIISLSNLSYEGLCIKLFKILNLGLDEALLKDVLRCYKSFDNPNNPAPLHKFSDNLFMLNLYSGPTRAFKDMALQPFGALLSHFAAQKKQTYLILAATSGDTGPATLESFANKPYIKVICLYPDGGTSDIQRLQMTTQNASNCKVIGIKGNFDDAQSALKNLLNDKDFITNLHAQGIYLSAANSVNIGRIVFQIIYHFWAYFSLLKNAQITFGEKISIVVPSGNFGNILGAFFAKKMGLPLQKLVVASNVNNILSDFIHSGVYDVSSRVLLRSKSPAMDILKSSNVERVL
ncbi:threonine synthase, partial [uncultured Helicobacter sp.]